MVCLRLAFQDLTVTLQKSAGILPIRKHKFQPTPLTGGAITKFFDRKQEQVSTAAPNLAYIGMTWILAPAVLSFKPCIRFRLASCAMQVRLQQQVQKQAAAAQSATVPAQAHKAATTSACAHSRPANTAVSAAPAASSGISKLHASDASAAADHKPPAALQSGTSGSTSAALPAASLEAKTSNTVLGKAPPQPKESSNTLYANREQLSHTAGPGTLAAVGINPPQHMLADSLYSVSLPLCSLQC